MAYIGQGAEGNFTTTNAKDSFSGNGSTVSFTLSAGATTNNVDVFVNNVRQEPTTAYSVDGTTLTFTEAPGVGTNNIYVVNRGPAQLTASHPASQALEAYSGDFATDVTIDGDLTVDTDTLHVDSTNNRVGVGTSSPSSLLHIEVAETTSYDGSATDGQLGVGPTLFLEQSGQGNNNAISQIVFQPRTGYGYNRIVSTGGSTPKMAFVTNNAERMRILSGGGITFNGDTAAANALDDYEEGTWTPVISDATSGGNTATTTSSDGFYTKVGRLVTVSLSLVNINTTGMTGTNAVHIQGLPFVNANKSPATNIAQGAVRADNIDIAIASAYAMTTTIGNGVSYIFLHINRDGTTDITVKVNQLNSGSADIFSTITYLT